MISFVRNVVDTVKTKLAPKEEISVMDILNESYMRLSEEVEAIWAEMYQCRNGLGTYSDMSLEQRAGCRWILSQDLHPKLRSLRTISEWRESILI